MACKRFLIFLGIVLAVGVATSAFARSFADVSGTPYQTAFSYLSDRSVVQGYPDGTGRPYGYLNRAEAVKVLLEVRNTNANRIEKFRKNPAPLPLFPDTTVTAWYTPYLEVAFEDGLITGYPDGTFKPGQLVKTEEAIALLLRNYSESGEPTVQYSTAMENRPNEWFSPYVSEVIARNVVSQRERMRLGTTITRGQFFDMVYRFSSLQSSGEYAFDDGYTQSVTQTVVTTGNASSLGPITFSNPTQSNTTNTVYTSGTSGGGGGGSSIISFPTSQGSTVTGARPAYASEKYFSISMPSLGISDLTITHPQNALTEDGILAPLQSGVGHLYSYPGGQGKIMIYGHSSGYPWDLSQYTKIFRQINKLQPGDKIYVTYDGTLHEYEVSHEQTIQASDTSPFDDNGAGEELILYTCWPPDSISQRYLVHATPVSKTDF